MCRRDGALCLYCVRVWASSARCSVSPVEFESFRKFGDQEDIVFAGGATLYFTR